MTLPSWKKSAGKADRFCYYSKFNFCNMPAKFSFIFIILQFSLYSTFAGPKELKSPLVFSFKLRERVELWNGMNALNYGDNRPSANGKLDDHILLQRVILGFKYPIHQRTHLAFHLQDSRAWGWSLRHSIDPSLFKIHPKNSPEPYYLMNPNEQFLEIYDAYLKHTFMGMPMEITFGRQKISFGDNRIFGPGEWGNTGRWTWDALRIQWSKNNYVLNLFAGGTKTHHP